MPIQFGADRTQDYQVLITAALQQMNPASPVTTLFFQFNVAAADIR